MVSTRLETWWEMRYDTWQTSFDYSLTKWFRIRFAIGNTVSLIGDVCLVICIYSIQFEIRSWVWSTVWNRDQQILIWRIGTMKEGRGGVSGMGRALLKRYCDVVDWWNLNWLNVHSERIKLPANYNTRVRHNDYWK